MAAVAAEAGWQAPAAAAAAPIAAGANATKQTPAPTLQNVQNTSRMCRADAPHSHAHGQGEAEEKDIEHAHVLLRSGDKGRQPAETRFGTQCITCAALWQRGGAAQQHGGGTRERPLPAQLPCAGCSGGNAKPELGWRASWGGLASIIDLSAGCLL